jgi:hypothetical protein
MLNKGSYPVAKVSFVSGELSEVSEVVYMHCK